MGEFLMHAAIFAFAIPTAIVVIIVIILASILLIAALLLGNRLRKSRRYISPGGSYSEERNVQSLYPPQQPNAWGAQQQPAGWGTQNPTPEQPAAPTTYGSEGDESIIRDAFKPMPAQIADQWGQPVQQGQQGAWAPGIQQPPPSTPPGGNAPWQQQGSGQAQQFENPDGDRTMLRSTDAEKPVYSAEQLKFTAFHPKEVTVETWNTLLVYAHIEPAVDAISKDAERFKIELSGAPRKVSAPATQLLLRETNITIVPECKGVAFNPKRFTFKWLEDWHRANFRFLAKQELSGSAENGRINIFAGPLLVGTLKLALLFEEQDVLLPAKDRNTQVTESLYKQIFASYSHDDSLIVLTCRNVYKALGINILIDIDTLRSGQLFSDALMRMIDTADIFQLFWSERSAKSAYVSQEWEYALRLNKGEGFVRPVYWEIPMAKPPEKLAQLHFAYLPAYTFTQPSHPRQEA